MFYTTQPRQSCSTCTPQPCGCDTTIATHAKPCYTLPRPVDPCSLLPLPPLDLSANSTICTWVNRRITAKWLHPDQRVDRQYYQDCCHNILWLSETITGDPRARIVTTDPLFDPTKPIRIKKGGYWYEFSLIRKHGTGEYYLSPIRKWADTPFNFIETAAASPYTAITEQDLQWSGYSFSPIPIADDECGCPLIYQASGGTAEVGWGVGDRVSVCLTLAYGNNYAVISPTVDQQLPPSTPWQFPGIRAYEPRPVPVQVIPRIALGSTVAIEREIYTIVEQVDGVLILDRAIPALWCGECKITANIAPPSGKVLLSEGCAPLDIKASGKGWYSIGGDRGCLMTGWEWVGGC
jgi:hypothetical protein